MAAERTAFAKERGQWLAALHPLLPGVQPTPAVLENGVHAPGVPPYTQAGSQHFCGDALVLAYCNAV